MMFVNINFSVRTGVDFYDQNFSQQVFMMACCAQSSGIK